jgi:tetratricopeptide (TPR) repeat protein
MSRAKTLASSGDLNAALSIATELVRDYPRTPRTWSFRAYVRALAHDYAGAIGDISDAIDVAPREPKLWFDRGRYNLRLERYSDAVADLTKGLDLCDQESNDYYREALLFTRAEALVQLGRAQEALADLAGVREDCTFWTYRLVSKKTLVDECLRMR